MANIPSIPPLLCSTPPPLDFNDDRDEGDDDTVLPPSLTLDEEYDGGYNAFAGTPPSTYIETNSDVPSLPGTPVQLASANCFESISDCIKIPTMAEDRYSEFQGNKEAKAMKPIEAFNFAIATAILESNSPPPLDLDGVVSNEEADEEDFQEFCTASQDSDPGGGDMSDDVEEEYSVIKTEDNLSLPSLKFDTLSISSEKFSACSRSSPSPTLLDDQGNSTQIIETLADNKDKASPNETSKFPLDVVQLEDLADDSSDDDGHSPEKGKNYIEDENADDFFAIHIINEDNHNVVLDTPSNEIWVKEDPSLNQDNLEFISSKRDMETNREKENPEERRKEKVNEFGDFTDFSVFQCASKSDVNTTNGIEEAEVQEPLETQNWDFEDEFDDFQDFTNAATVSNLESVPGKETEPEIQKIPTSSVTTTHMEDSEDEFGDFSDATFTPAPSVPDAVHIQSINIPNPVSSNNVNDKLLPILEMMFPNIYTTSGDSNEGTKNIKTSPPEDNTKHLKLDAVDNAKALGYHWTKSDIRHSLIRSLGIDSRNILFGDKWNSSMPRFAANLTFNPLEPLKPQQVHKHSDKAHSNAAQRTANKSKSDVPAVEFDWNTSGLVNPLDASQVHTLLLDVDQLMVVANLDKINLDSSPCCSSSSSICTTLMDFLTTTTTTTTTAAAANKNPTTSCDTTNGNTTSSGVNAFQLLNGIASIRTPGTDILADVFAEHNLDPFVDDLFCAPSCSTYSFDKNTNVNVSNNNRKLLSIDDSPACKHTNYQNNNNTNNNNAFVFNTRSINNTCTNSVNTTTNHHVDLIDINNHHFDTHNYFTTTTTNAHIDPIQTTYFNAVYANPFGTTTNHVTNNQYLDCRSKEVTHGRETETVHTSQPGTFNASADLQPSHSTIANSDNNDDGKLASNSNLNTTTASPTITDPTTTTAISSIISTDSLGYSINDSGNNIDLSTCPQNETGLVTTPISVSDPVTATTATFAATDTLYINTKTFFAANAFNSKKEYFSDNDLDEVVTTSTFAGPLKETHIYTPSKQDTVGITTKTAPIDFDYEIAAAGIIIDEKVVKKEYRDVEYNPGFVLEFTRAQPSDMQQTNTDNSTIFKDIFDRDENQHHAVLNKSVDVSEVDEEFSDFQYVPATQLQASNVPTTTQQSSQSIAGMRSKDIVTNNRTPTVGRGEMILSPSILLPQAILLESSKPKIEWGDTTANINPEELARIEELFPQPKTEASSHKSSPQHNGYELQTQARQPQNSLSISATIAQKEQQADDDDWTEFVSVPVVEPVFQHQPKPKLRHNHFSSPNNNILITSSINRMQQLEHHASALQTTKSDELTATSEEEWSDFVSSTPQANTEYRALPQFNSAAWQNANFYNNPLSFYQNQTHANGVSKLQHNNNNSMTSNYNNNYNQLYQQQDQHHHQQRQLQLQQQIGIMQDFSTAPPSQRRSANTPIVSERNTQFHVGSAKVAPCISLIPDLGFIAPATPTHTAFINTLPKPSFNMKK